jgi:hypothetical protein
MTKPDAAPKTATVVSPRGAIVYDKDGKVRYLKPGEVFEYDAVKRGRLIVSDGAVLLSAVVLNK